VTTIAVATLANGWSLMAIPVWIYPDSIDYIQLASGILEGGNWSNRLWLIRPPGYPLLLASIFTLFGSASPIALAVFQHILVGCTAILAALIGWNLTSRVGVALLVGLLCAGSLQLLAYANLALTEVPYAALLVGIVFLLVGPDARLSTRRIAMASALAGIAYLIKPIGLYLVGVCTLGAILAANRSRRRLLSGLIAAILPACIMVAPWKAATAITFGQDDTDRCLDYVLYLRAAEFDRLDSTTSEAMLEIKRVVAEAKSTGDLPKSATPRDRATVIKAFESVRGASFSESTAVMGRAGGDLMREHYPTIALNTMKYAAWLMLAPDPVYRFVPGGTPGEGGKRAPEANFYDIATYSTGAGSWEHVLRDHREYLPLDSSPTAATPSWTSLIRAFHTHVDQAPGVIGIADSLYGELMLACGLGGVFCLLGPRRCQWLIPIGVVISHVLISAFLGGPQTRYAAPIKPLLMIFGAVFTIRAADGLKCCLRVARSLVSDALTRSAKCTGSSIESASTEMGHIRGEAL